MKIQTKNITLNSYIIKNDDYFHTALEGLTIYLPTSPKEGQSHIIKGLGNCYLNPIFVIPLDSLIDGESMFSINTVNGYVSVFYSQNNWYIIK